jgi:hypothetical protein
MGRAFVRQTVAAFFAPPAVPGLYTVYRAEPKNIPGPAFFDGAPAGTASGAVAFPHIESQIEQRIAMGGPTSGWKMVPYDVALVVRFKSNRQESEDAVDDWDTILENIVDRLRSDRQLGTSAQQSPTIFQAGEGDTFGGEDIHVLSDLPKAMGTGQQIVAWAAVRFKAIEMVEA